MSKSRLDICARLEGETPKPWVNSSQKMLLGGFPGTKFSGLHPIKDFLGALPLLFDQTVGDSEIEILEITAQENRVAIVAKGNMALTNGRVYDSDYNFFFTFRNGKIASGREYLDGVLVNRLFGPPLE